MANGTNRTPRIEDGTEAEQAEGLRLSLFTGEAAVEAYLGATARAGVRFIQWRYPLASQFLEAGRSAFRVILGSGSGTPGFPPQGQDDHAGNHGSLVSGSVFWCRYYTTGLLLAII